MKEKNGSQNYLIIHISAPIIYQRQRKEPEPVTKCSADNGSQTLQQHLTKNCSTQVDPYDLDKGNYSHMKNCSTQTEQLRQRSHGVQTVPCSQSSNATQTLSEKKDLKGPFSDSVYSSSEIIDNSTPDINKAYLNRLMKLKLDGPIIHGPFYCDCPGGLRSCKQYQF
jgi:hypothetical protein